MMEDLPVFGMLTDDQFNCFFGGGFRFLGSDRRKGVANQSLSAHGHRV